MCAVAAFKTAKKNALGLPSYDSYENQETWWHDQKIIAIYCLNTSDQHSDYFLVHLYFEV